MRKYYVEQDVMGSDLKAHFYFDTAEERERYLEENDHCSKCNKVDGAPSYERWKFENDPGNYYR